MNHNFNIFRINCLLYDSGSGDFNQIIECIVCDLLYQIANKGITTNKIYQYVDQVLQVNTEKDSLKEILVSSNNLEYERTENDLFFRLNDKKYEDILFRVENYSLESFVKRYLSENKYSPDLVDKIIELFYYCLYENINSFSSNNLNTIIPPHANSKYNQYVIDVFNDFISFDDKQKNNAIYATFYKAFEFALLTSGKAINFHTKSIFEDKFYILDTNIIFRLLGVDGPQREESLKQLFRKCSYQGLKFVYTKETYREFSIRLRNALEELKDAVYNKKIQIIADLYEEKSSIFNDGFLIHFTRLRSRGELNTPNQYDLYMNAGFKKLESELGFELLEQSSPPTKLAINTEASKIREKKYKDNNKTRYRIEASKVDAFNILSVRQLRGQNLINYSNIKSFYFTTDRALNRIMGNPDGFPETILPSQVFLLHNPLSDHNDTDDYKNFVNFLKRRTTEFKYNGPKILRHIEDVRIHTHNSEHIKEIIKAAADKRYQNAKSDLSDVEIPETINEYAATYMDSLIEATSSGNENYKAILKNAKCNLAKAYNISRTIVRTLYILSFLFLLPILLVLAQFFNLYLQIMITIILGAINFYMGIRTKLLCKVWKKMFNIVIKFYHSIEALKNDQIFRSEKSEFIKSNFNSLW